ncbi:MAG: hypothetical protein GF416_03340 [Candidatus Altiarchaeales archaeon]|nr:hypothetical protein [Candidatus Altiarchaeales archaeon]MBD3416153.1 hypothetical protein [Candidatus Altiarchaeales archaeon]
MSRSSREKPGEQDITVRVGKKGVTPELIAEIRTILRKHKKVNVKMLKSSLGERDKHQVTEEIRSKTKARKASLKGHTIRLQQ